MFSGLIGELKRQAATAGRAVRTREFWMYAVVIVVLLLIAVAGVYLASGFDPFTRSRLKMGVSCQAGEMHIGVIIVGSFVFTIACVFTLGEVTHWIEEKRLSRAPGRRMQIGSWRPILHVIGTVVLGVTGFILMSAWCS